MKRPKKKILITAIAIIIVAFVVVAAIVSKTNNGQSSANIPASSTIQNAASTTAIISLATPSSKPSQTSPSTTPSSPAAANPSSVAITSPTCKLTLRFEATSGNPAGTGKVTYQLVVGNSGGTPCQSASISVYYNDGESYISATPTPTAHGYYWKFGDLAPGKTTAISLATQRSMALAIGNDTTQACLSANNGSDACANASAGGSIAGTTSGAPVTTGGTASAGNATPPAVPTPTLTAFPEITGREIGVWEWTPLSQMSAATMQQVVNEASANHFTVIYQTIDEYLSIDALPDGIAKQQKLATYEQSVNNFLTLASAKGIVVDAEAGWRDWAEAGNTWEASDIMNFVASYNQSHTEKFRGVQYDIEPYLLPQYGANRAGILTNYVKLVGGLATQSKGNNIPLTIIIPDFYESSSGKTPNITVGGKTDSTYHFILQALAPVPRTRIIVMAYHNVANGTGGSIALSQEEINDANSTGVSVIVAQETGPVSPSYVTFSGTSRESLFSQIGGIDTAFSSDKSFKGVAIDYLDTYLELSSQ
jgi:hypothetical protein